MLLDAFPYSHELVCDRQFTNTPDAALTHYSRTRGIEHLRQASQEEGGAAWLQSGPIRDFRLKQQHDASCQSISLFEVAWAFRQALLAETQRSYRRTAGKG